VGKKKVITRREEKRNSKRKGKKGRQERRLWRGLFGHECRPTLFFASREAAFRIDISSH
jgi:hypothetical protein